MKNEVNRALVAKKKFCKSSLTLLAGFLLTFAFPSQGWANLGSHDNHYGKVTVTSSGSGTVYIGTTDAATSGKQEETWSCNESSSNDEKTYYVFAKPDPGWTFKGWSGDAGGTDSPYTLTVKAESTNQGSPTTKNLTATFVPVFQFKAKADFATSSTGSGEVCVSFSEGSPTYQGKAMEIKDTQDGTSDTDTEETKKAYFYAQPKTGSEFRGWYSDAAGTVLVNSNEAYSQSITSSVIAEPASPQLTLYAKFEKVAVEPTWTLEGVAGTSKTLEIGETIKLVTETDGNSYSWGTPSFVDAGETNPVMNYDPATKTFTANRAGTVTVRFTQAAGEAGGVLWKAGEQTFTFTVEKRTPEFAWADPLPHFTVGTTLPASHLFSFSPAECEQNWTLTSSDPTNVPSIASGAAGLVMPKEVDGVTLTFHQPATWEWKEIANTSIKINVTKEPVVFNWKNPSLIAGNTYSWTDFVETNSEGAWNLVSDDESVIPTMRSIANTSVQVAAGSVTLSFTQGQDLGHDAVSIQTKTFTVYPSNGIATYSVNGNTYTDLQSAINASVVGSKKYNIIVASDGIVLPGNYTIPSGVTLVVPYESTGTKGLTKPTVLKQEPFGIQPFRTLKLTDGVNITVNGAISVTAEVQSGDAAKNPTGFPVRNVGVIDMSAGGHIDVNSGGTIYAWGFIRGQGYLDGNNTQNVGTITAKNGSTIKECYGIGDWGGGSYTYALVKSSDKSYRIYPFQSYCVQNIEVPLRIEYGANDLLFTTVYGNSTNNDVSDIKFIGNKAGSLFLISSSNGVVTKWYDPTTDHMVVEVEGDTKLDNMQITISVSILSFTIQASNFDLPIPSNMHIKFKNCNLSLTSPLVLQPGAIFEIPEGSSLSLASNLFVYDKDEWGKYIQKKYFWPLPTIPTPKVSRGDGATNTLDDAKLIVDGTFTIASGGALYTTASGADIMGNGGGQLVWNRTLPANGHVYGYNNGNGVDGSNTSSRLKPANIENNECTPAKLHNDNDSYTASLSNTTFKNLNGRWFKSADAVELADHTYKFTYIDGDNTAATTFCVYTSDKTGLKAGYKWVNVALDNDFCGGKTFLGEDGNYYYYDGASKDAVSKWIQLVKLSDALYSGSDNNLYTFTDGCAWASVGEIDDECMYTIEDVKMALVGAEFVAIEKDEYDEVYVKTTDHSDYYMLFDGCVWQHATKIPDTYKAYEVLGNPYIWMGEEWVEVAAEGSYFYTVDDQGIKHFYEFDNTTFTWVPVRNKVRITTPTGDKRDFLTFDDAIAYLSQYNDPTITLLEDVTATKAQTFAPGSKSTTATIDLNGHTVTANIGSAAYFLNMNTSATLYITDNSDKGNGQILIYAEGNKEIDGIYVTKGNVVMNGGRLYMENGAVYASNTSCKASAIYLKAGQTLTINGGEIEVKAHRYAYGVFAASTTALASSSIVTMNGGKVTAIAASYAYGILSYGIINMKGGTIDAKTEAVTSAGGTTAAGSYAYGIYGHASPSAVDANSYYSTINMTGGTVNATAYSQYAYGVYGYSTYTTANGKKSDGTSDNTYKPTDGTYSNKVSCKLNITGGEINAIAKTSTQSYGIYSAGTYNSYVDKSPSNIKPHVIKNVKVFAQATGTAYGILMSAQTHEYSGGLLWGEAVIDNADVYAETTSSTNAYAVYASATNIWTNRARYSQVSASNKKTWFVKADNNDGDVTHEGIAATTTQVYQYQIGCHVAGAKITINSGNYRAKSANSTSAYGVYCNRSVCPGDPTGNTAGMAEVIINGGTFSAETMTDTGYGISNGGITTVNGGTINVHTGTSTAYGVYGWGGTLTLNSGVVINSIVETTTAYGVAANGSIDGNLGLHTHGEVIVNDGVVVNVKSPNSTTAYGAYALATNAELSQTTYNARSASNKTTYYAVNEEGVTVTNATTANYLPYRFGTYVEGGEITINGGTFNVTTFGSTAIGAGTNLSNLVRTTELGRVKVGRGVLNVHGGTFNVESETSSTAEGIRSYGITHVDGGTFNILTKTTTAYGVCARDGETVIDGGTFNVTAGTSTAVGASAWADDYNTDYGYYYQGDLTVNDGTFNVKTWNGSEAYGVQVRGTTKNMAAAKVVIDGVADAKKDYAIAGTATINGGTFIMTPSNGTKAYSTYVYTTQSLGTATATPTCYVKGGFFQTNGATTSGMYVSALKENNVVTGGHFSDNTGLTSATASKNYVNAPYAVINCVDPEYKATYPYEIGDPVEITFVTDNGVELWRGNQPKGKTAIYPLTNGTPERASDDAHSYEFTNWDKELAEVLEPTTYTANFNTVGKKFMITWVDDKGNEIDHKEYTADEMPVHADPIKDGHNFTGWTPAMYAVDKDQTYTAGFSIKQYTIRFVDEDGTVLKEQTINHGATPSKPSNPTKEGYSFSAWNPGIVAATEDVTYTATYLLNIASVTTSAGVTTNYTAWSSALTAANAAENSTLTVLTDVGGLASQAIKQSFILDLNGHTLSGTANKLLDLQTAGKTLTIRDSQGGGSIETKSATSQLVAVYVTKGTLNIEGGHIRAENTYTSTSTSYYGCGVLVSSGYVCNMSGGTVEGITNIDLAYGLYNNGGTVTITGGTINAQAQTKAYGVHVKGNTTVTNAVVNATTTRTTIADAFYVTAAKTLTINSGVFTANTVTTAGYAVEATAAATINVNDGKFKATTKPISNTGGATIKVAAGFYDKDTELAGFTSPKKVVALTTEPEKAEGYNYKIVDAAYQVTFKAEDGTVLQQTNVEKDLQPVYVGEAQTKASTPKYAYDFDGWMDASDSHVYAELPVASKDVVYTAHFVQNAVKYPITFTNIDGMGTDYVQMVAFDEMPVYDGPTPYMSGAVSNYAYTFIGWDPELAVVTGPTSYSPRYDLVISHNVSFVINNASATTPTTLTVAEGAAVECPADQLVDCQHIIGWYKDAGLNEEWDFANDKMGTSDLLLYAKWGTKTYTITWLDELGDVIVQTVVNCGDVPTHANLYKPSTAAYSYEWLGWNKTRVAATADATYKSLGFKQVAKRYAITFVTGQGATVIAPIEQEVGSAITKPADPTRTGYTFAGWDKEIPATMPAEDMTITANWTINQYTITFDTEGGSEVAAITQDYNTAIVAPANPTKTGYTFADWDKAIPATMPAENMTITANWTINQYTITFDTEGGSEVAAITQDYNTAITAPANPTREGYTFAGWDKEIPATMPAEDMTITANWTAVPTTAKYTVKHYKLHIKNGEKFAEPFKTDESEEVEIGTEVTPEFEEIKGYDPPAKYQTITISANPNENVVIYEYSISKTNKLEVDEGNTKTINDSTEAYTVVLAPGKTMNITGKGSVTAQNLVLQSVPGDNTGANLTTTDNLEILGKVCIEIEMNKSGTMDDKLFYCFSVPFAVNVADGVERLHKDNNTWSKAVLNTNYRVYTYNEADRATNGRQDSNWKEFKGTQFLPGVFYLCEFDNSNYNRYRFYAAEGASLNNKGDIEVTKSSENKDGGWNGVANNGLTDNKLGGKLFTHIQTLNSEGNSFESAKADEKPLAIGNAAMVQVSASGSVVVGETSSAVAARRMGEAASTEFINVRLYKENQDKHVDQIFIRASEDAAEQYVAGIDLSKATMGTPKVARLWVNDYDLQLVANEALMTNDQATFSLGMSAPANGEYTIALNEVPTDATIYLTENGSAIWNLNIAPAPISLSKGTENSYGLRLVRKINNVVTGFDEAVLNGNVQKVILNDHLYIIRDGKVYSAHGHVIK